MLTHDRIKVAKTLTSKDQYRVYAKSFVNDVNNKQSYFQHALPNNGINAVVCKFVGC